MKTMTLVWFSGTGNTWLAAQALADALRAGGVDVKLRRMEAVVPPLTLAPDETLGLAFPVACFSSYPTVWRFLEALPPGEGRGVALIATMGGASGGLSGPLGRFLRARGYRTLGAVCCVMPGNYGNKTIPVAANARRVARMRETAADFGRALLAGQTQWPAGYGLWSSALVALSRTSRPWRFFKRLFPLAVDRTRCTRCGLCAKLCPAGAIHMEDGPVWADTCESCQRCIGYCPAQAIHVPGKPAQPYAAAPVGIFLGSEAH